MLRALRTDGHVQIEVEDECGGIPGRADDSFKAFSDRRMNDRTGLGLGLSIARKAVKLHGGDIHVRNLPGKGCVFVIELPLAEQERPTNHRSINEMQLAHFVIELVYKADLSAIDAHMAAHVKFLKKYYASGNFLISGRKIPRDGGIILAVGKSRAGDRNDRPRRSLSHSTASPTFASSSSEPASERTTFKRELTSDDEARTDP